ncbi:MAG: S-layer homology domain-containing protein [Clostridiales bacterium]|nr:MAG: S-layer homology domain-containing protein [Clostridiales bacterium]
MFVTILHRIDGKKTEGENKFADVADGAYYKNAVAWAVKNGIVMGVSDTEFAPDENITREQMASILFRYAKIQRA